MEAGIFDKIINVVLHDGAWAALSIYLVYKLLSRKDLYELLTSYHDCVVDNTRVTERLAMLIEERVRAQSGGKVGQDGPAEADK